MPLSSVRPLEVTVRRGPHSLHAVVVRAGEDLVVTVGGGERPHVGCVALALARPSTADPARTSASTSLLAIPPHQEGELASRLASGLARALGVVVVVTAGIHTDALDDEGIRTFLDLGEDLERVLLRRLGARRS